MAEDFEKDERKKFGEGGFATMVHRVADLEKKARHQQFGAIHAELRRLQMALARHARPCAGHPRLKSNAGSKTWMAGTSPAMTKWWPRRKTLYIQRILVGEFGAFLDESEARFGLGAHQPFD
jgi:hypothetical protein